jgi:hypothetical protein
MKPFALCLILLLPLAGCPTSPTPPLAPGYSNSADQQLGQDLAAVVGFTDQEKINYATLPATQQAAEKSYLNTLINSVNAANAAYNAFHQGTQTLIQAQQALATAQNAQAAVQQVKGVK